MKKYVTMFFVVSILTIPVSFGSKKTERNLVEKKIYTLLKKKKTSEKNKIHQELIKLGDSVLNKWEELITKEKKKETKRNLEDAFEEFKKIAIREFVFKELIRIHDSFEKGDRVRPLCGEMLYLKAKYKTTYKLLNTELKKCDHKRFKGYGIYGDFRRELRELVGEEDSIKSAKENIKYNEKRNLSDKEMGYLKKNLERRILNMYLTSYTDHKDYLKEIVIGS